MKNKMSRKTAGRKVARCHLAGALSARCRLAERGGFTLVELLITLVCSSLILFAAMTWMMVGIRVETSAAKATGRQQKARMMITLMESMANSGKISRVQGIRGRTVAEGETPVEGAAGNDWALLDRSNAVLLRYRAGSGTLVSGSGAVLMGGLEHASGTFVEDTGLLQLSLRADGEEYATNIFCRTAVKADSYDAAKLLQLTAEQLDALGEQARLTMDQRLDFLNLLSTQYGSDGKIIGGFGSDGAGSSGAGGGSGTGAGSMGSYFTEYYLSATGQHALWNGANAGADWGTETPWCATFVSWAMHQMGGLGPDGSGAGSGGDGSGVGGIGGIGGNGGIGGAGGNSGAGQSGGSKLWRVPVFATVDDGRALFGANYQRPTDTAPGTPVYGKDHSNQLAGWWMDAHPSSGSGGSGSAGGNNGAGGAAIPSPGDLAFFDWKDENGVQDGRLEHVGVVLYVDREKEQIFTIEGNSDGQVALRSYSLVDSDIVGYGVLDWVEPR